VGTTPDLDVWRKGINVYILNYLRLHLVRIEGSHSTEYALIVPIT